VTRLSVRLAASLVRIWTLLYTWRTPPPVREARRRELESDLWESQHDPGASTGMAYAVQIVARLLIGIPDDLAWRFEQGQVANGSRRRIAVVVGVGSVLALLLVIASRTSPLPPLPDAPEFPRRTEAPPPPPPPPPPCAPPAFRPTNPVNCTP
jgi:hypothetical protein